VKALMGTSKFVCDSPKDRPSAMTTRMPQALWVTHSPCTQQQWEQQASCLMGASKFVHDSPKDRPSAMTTRMPQALWVTHSPCPPECATGLPLKLCPERCMLRACNLSSPESGDSTWLPPVATLLVLLAVQATAAVPNTGTAAAAAAATATRGDSGAQILAIKLFSAPISKLTSLTAPRR
jgi:hypothetical protein